MVARKHVLSLLKSGATPEIGVFPDGRDMTLESFKPLGRERLRRATVRLGDGQTVLLDVEEDTVSSPAAAKVSRRGNHESLTTDVGSDTGDAQTPRRVARQPGAVEGIILRSANFSHCASFYAQLLGAHVTIRDRTLRIAPWLLLRETDHQSTEAGGEIFLTVPDVNALMARLNIDPALRRGDTIMLQDPDGRTVYIKQTVRPARFEVLKDHTGAFRFHLKAANGEIIASSQGYTSKAAIEKAIQSVSTSAAGAKVEDLTEPEYPRC
jgi:uncharacterized protein YegP (UPF0339 family)